MLLACGDPPEPAALAPEPGQQELEASTAELPPSIYGLPMALRDQTGSAHGLDVYAGHHVLISMFYGSCRSACPLLITDLKRVDALAQEAGRSDLRVLMVSFDPERDDTDVLAALADQHELDGARWRLSAPTEGDARDLSAVLDIGWRDVGGGMFQHDSVLILLDPSGRPVARLDGLNQDAAPLMQALVGQ